MRGMAQTQATVEALQRDRFLCQWHYWRKNVLRNVYQYTTGDVLGGGHHIFGRARVDEVEAIIGLCSECHSKATRNIIKQSELIQLQNERLGIRLDEQYPQYCNYK